MKTLKENFFKNLGIGKHSLIEKWMNDSNFKKYMTGYIKYPIWINSNTYEIFSSKEGSERILKYLIKFKPELPDYIKFEFPKTLEIYIYKFEIKDFNLDTYLNALNKYFKHIVYLKNITIKNNNIEKVNIIKNGNKFEIENL